jgi:hypothetical protein
MESKTIKVILKNADSEELGFISHLINGNECIVKLRYRGDEIECRSSDFFKAFCLIRRHIESEGLIPLCYGASQNVYPSGMCRDMGSGLVAYKLKMGCQANRSDMVNIFDSGPDVIPSSVDGQSLYYQNWIRSTTSGWTRSLIGKVATAIIQNIKRKL